MASFMRQFEAGRKSWLEILNTQREVVDSRIAYGERPLVARTDAGGSAGVLLQFESCGTTLAARGAR